MFSSTIVEGEKKDLESKISKLEVQKDANDKQAEKLKAQVVELEAYKNLLETQLKEANERQQDITLF